MYKFEPQNIPMPPGTEERYNALMHAMQTGVKLENEWNPRSQIGEFPVAANCEPKHLRVGVNSALIETSALAQLLIAKRLIEPEEYWASIMAMLEIEVENYKRRLANMAGREINLL